MRNRLLNCVLIGLLSLPLAHASADVKIDVRPGFENYYRPEAWTPLSINLTGSAPTGNGELQVAVRTREGAETVYTYPIRLLSNLNERHNITYLHQSGISGGLTDVTIYVAVDGRRIAEKKVDGALALVDTQPLLVALTQDRSGLSSLQKADLGFLHRFAFNRYGFNNMMGGGNGNNPPLVGANPVRVAYAAASELPDSPFGYAAADTVILGDLPLDSFTDDQWKALTAWVHDGGRLVICGGSDANRLRAAQLADLLPVNVSGVRQVSGLPSLGTRYEHTLTARSVAVAVTSLKKGATLVCAHGDLPLIAFKPYGVGSVVFTAFDPMSPEMKGWTGQQNLWAELAQLGGGEAQAIRSVMASAQANSYYSNSGRTIGDALAGSQSTEAPSFTFIGMFLLLYIICLVPVNYFLLRKLDKKELAWLTAPAIIIAFSTGAYAIGYSVKGGQLFLRFGTVLEGAANSDSFHAYTMASIFSPSMRRYDLSVQDAGALPVELRLENIGITTSGSDIMIQRDKKTTVKDALVNMWDHRNFAFQSRVRIPALKATAVTDGAGLKVSVNNTTGYTLNDCMISYKGQTIAVGTLQPGASHGAQVALIGGRGGGVIGSVSTGAQTGDSTQSRIKTALGQLVSSNENGGVSGGEDPLLFTGWFSDSVTGLALENERPTVEGINLLAVHIPLPPAGRLDDVSPRNLHPQRMNNGFPGSMGSGAAGR